MKRYFIASMYRSCSGILEINQQLQVRTEFAGSGATAFVYLLLDPRKLPADSDDITFEQFVKAVFYVGKGTKVFFNNIMNASFLFSVLPRCKSYDVF